MDMKEMIGLPKPGLVLAGLLLRSFELEGPSCIR
jgi:hypothetical protein